MELTLKVANRTGRFVAAMPLLAQEREGLWKK